MPRITDSKYMVMAGWDDVPHLDERTKRELLESTPPYLRDARSKGMPSLGSGAIYPVEESDIKVDPFKIPIHWPIAFGLDVGWNRTAAIWGATDRENRVTYLFAEHYRGQAEPIIHAQGIKAKGEWIPGAIDPASRGRGQRDGEQLIDDYRNLGLNLVEAVNTREAGIFRVWEMLSTGQLKVFSSLRNWFAEYRIYRRDEKGRIVKEFDHLMDATRYYVMTGMEIAITKPSQRSTGLTGYMPADRDVGY